MANVANSYGAIRLSFPDQPNVDRTPLKEVLRGQRNLYFSRPLEREGSGIYPSSSLRWTKRGRANKKKLLFTIPSFLGSENKTSFFPDHPTGRVN